ncbi:MAG: penicillin-binding protein 2, partial [Nitrospirae bacterium]
SCDVYFYQVGVRLGVDRIAYFARAFGLGRPTGIALREEKAGLVPTTAWKERRTGEPWMRGETVSVSIGQGAVLVTPLQLAVAYAALANGGVVVQPRLLLRIEDLEGRVVEEVPPRVRGTVPVDADHLARIARALESVVSAPGGTGVRARIEGVRVAGKTGTTQVVSLKRVEGLEDGEVPRRYRDHGWFAAFAPVESPEIVVVALAEHGGGGGTAAAPMVRHVLERYFARRGAPPGLERASGGDPGAGPRAAARGERRAAG